MQLKFKAILIILLMGIALFMPSACAQPLEETCPLSLSAPAYVLMEAETGTILFEHHADDKRQSASLNKLMSILLFLEALENETVTTDTLVTVSSSAAATPGSTALLDAGSSYPFGDLMRACIVASGNDSTVALAEHIAGTQEAFVDMMNAKGESLHLSATHFNNCTGLSDDSQYSCARDLAIISREICRYPLYIESSSLWLSDITHPSGRKTDLTNTNRLVRFFDLCDGLKTGSSPEAKYCISATAEKDSLRLIAVLLGANTSKARFDEARELLEYGLNNYKRIRILSEGDLTGYSVAVLHGAVNSVQIAAGKGLSMLLRNGQEKELSVELKLPDSITAPRNKGEKIGEINILLSGQLVAVIPAVLAHDVQLPSLLSAFLRIQQLWR